jgi:hypothetical protein
MRRTVSDLPNMQCKMRYYFRASRDSFPPPLGAGEDNRTVCYTSE